MPIPLPGDMLSRRAGAVTHYGTAVDSFRVLDIVPGGPPGDGQQLRVHRDSEFPFRCFRNMNDTYMSKGHEMPCSRGRVTDSRASR